jgi:alpha-beta hydrolase superfamily lysophospholipase
LGVKADLHIWEGLDHAFYFEPDLPESAEAYEVIVKFFASHLSEAR